METAREFERSARWRLDKLQRSKSIRVLQLLTAGFLLAAAMFLIVMLTSPPMSEAADTESGATIAPTSLVLVKP